MLSSFQQRDIDVTNICTYEEAKQLYFTIESRSTHFAGIHKQIHFLLRSYFWNVSKNHSTLSVFMSKPRFSYTQNKVNILIFYYVKSIRTRMHESGPHKQFIFSQETILELSTKITQLSKKEVSLEFFRVYYPYINSSIFAQYLSHNASANTFIRFQNAIHKYLRFRDGQNLPASIQGMKIQVSGRLATERIIPRVTTKSRVFGSIKNAAFVDYSQHTSKNLLGAFTIKVWIAQRKAL